MYVVITCMHEIVKFTFGNKLIKSAATICCVLISLSANNIYNYVKYFLSSLEKLQSQLESLGKD